MLLTPIIFLLLMTIYNTHNSLSYHYGRHHRINGIISNLLLTYPPFFTRIVKKINNYLELLFQESECCRNTSKVTTTIIWIHT
ncbi:hypothetical protein GJ496_004028 [Pomphorhynchus laevis]|nr:hypothetical protein GJ496_004028 [Pomphorhynchus laevis]